MDKFESPLVWIDLEMTGLNPEIDSILEIATVITDNNLNVIASGPSLVINQSDIVLAGMDDWNTEQHTKSGLMVEVRSSKISLEDAQAITLDFIKQHCSENRSPLCGNSVWQDRIFLRKYMPAIDSFLNYRIIDVSSIKEVIRRWYPNNPAHKFYKPDNHRACEDIEYSIAELKHYREHFFIAVQ
jgi:oligoribonuclease